MIQEFINFHRDKFGFCLDWLIDKLNTIAVDNEDWLSNVNKGLNYYCRKWSYLSPDHRLRNKN